MLLRQTSGLDLTCSDLGEDVLVKQKLNAVK